MAVRKTLNEKIEAAQAEITQRENHLKELRAKQKEQERKDRNHRLCKRMGLFEKLMPDTIALTDEQFQTFLEKAVANDYGRRMLSNIASQGTANKPTETATQQANNNSSKSAEQAPPNILPTSAKPTTAASNGGTSTFPSGSGTTRQGG